MLREATRYALVQVVAYAVDYGAFAAGLSIGLTALAANVVGKLLAGALAFVLHRRITFDASREPLLRQMLSYAGLLLLNLPLASGLLYLLLSVLPPYGAKIGADVASVGITFLLSRQLVFARKDRP